MRRQKTHFLNVDLDLVLRHPRDLLRLVRALRPGAYALNVEGEFASLELNDSYRTVDATLHGFVKLIEALRPAARLLWDECAERRFDIGIQAGEYPYSARFAISRRSVAEVERVGGSIVITLYATGPREPPGKNKKRRPPKTGYLVSNDKKLGDESELFRDLEK
jgi:hypothetical protein